MKNFYSNLPILAASPVFIGGWDREVRFLRPPYRPPYNHLLACSFYWNHLVVCHMTPFGTFVSQRFHCFAQVYLCAVGSLHCRIFFRDNLHELVAVHRHRHFTFCRFAETDADNISYVRLRREVLFLMLLFSICSVFVQYLFS